VLLLSHVLFLGWQTTVSRRDLSLSVFPLFWRRRRMFCAFFLKSKHSFLPEVREFITRHTAYNKHDTGWAKGAPSEDHTTPPSSRTASGGSACWGGAPAGARPFRGFLPDVLTVESV
jgi:hypothetical protein